MKKQILFADGGQQLPQLTPADRAALAATPYLEYDYYDHITLNKQKVVRTRFRKRGVNQSSLKALGLLCKRLDPNIAGFDETGNNWFDLYSTHSYGFYGRNLMEVLRELCSKVAGLPSVVDDDEYQPSNGRVVTAGPKNFCPMVEYRIPFDTEAWKARHDTAADVTTKDAQAAQVKADAEHRQNEADLLLQKAKARKTLRIVLIVLAIVAVAAVAVVIIKKN